MNILKEIVSGKKSRVKEEDFNLDLTYITNRIIAMAFPASGFESMYRNNIDDVKKYIEKNHNTNYFVFNLSNRKYDYKKFND
jgi:phosphatidylinositol-3,4,5-trisphosphate 3-phosphatase/dual-specificity protein phosphatase PTEN